MKKGDILINRYGETHKIVSAPQEGLRFYYIGFQIDPRRVEAELVPVSDFFEDSRLSVAHGQFHLAEPLSPIVE